jgi:hypothetical protein
VVGIIRRVLERKELSLFLTKRRFLILLFLYFINTLGLNKNIYEILWAGEAKLVGELIKSKAHLTKHPA